MKKLSGARDWHAEKLGASLKLKMRISFVCMFLALCQLSANSMFSQEKLQFEHEEVPLVQVLDEIQKQSGYSFFYNSNRISIRKKVSVRANQESVKTVLDRLAGLGSFQYEFKGRLIVLTKEKEPPTKMEEQDTELQGQVNDDEGAPLPGANVLVKGTSIGTQTDFDGKFTIEVPERSETLVISYIGFKTQEVAIAGQDNITVQLEAAAAQLEDVVVVGSRGKPRTNVERPVPIDVISSEDLASTGQQDIGQALQFSAPSFTAVKFGINDLAPLVDPATLRGLAPDQTLLLVNGKRRHKVSFFSLNDGVGKGQLGNDINAIPGAAVKRVEILRDGAAAQYGSDAIAGVMNMQLKDAREGGSVTFYTGVSSTNPKYDDLGSNADLEGESIYGGRISDGHVYNMSANFGLPWGEEGFVNTTLAFSHAEPSDRSGTYSHSTGWYTDEQVAAAGAASDEELQRINGIDLDRAILGTAENTNGALFVNMGRPVSEDVDFYAFGGFTMKKIIGSVFSRSPARNDRNALDIFPNGYNPELPSLLTDWQVTSGIKGDIGKDWNMDASLGYSGNNVDFFARNTVNPSWGADSPTQFYTGSLNVTQTVFNLDFAKIFSEKTTLALGSELRFESFQQSQGDAYSWAPGPLGGKDATTSGRAGFSDLTDGEWTRNNIGIYAELEQDFTEDFLIAAAARYENYSDFGDDWSFKMATRYKLLDDKLSFRGSVNRSFRAPSLVQFQYSNYGKIQQDTDGNTVVTPFLPIRNELTQQAFGITELKPETSFDIALGLTSKLSDKLSFTLDVYNIAIDDRILVSGGIPAADFAEFANTNYDEINVFTNAVNTTTKGLDFVANYKTYVNDKDQLRFSLAANFNETTIDGFNLPGAFADREEDLIDDRDILFLTKGIPNSKIIASGEYQFGIFSTLLRLTRFGEVADAREPDPGAESGFQEFAPKFVTDLSVTANFTEKVSLTAGVNNLFDEYPDMLLSPNVRGEVIYSRRTNQFGTQGRFLNMSLNYRW